MLWQRTLTCMPAPSTASDSGTDVLDSLVCALATALADLLAPRGGDELAAAALRIVFDPRLVAWHGAMATDASRPPRVVAAATRLRLYLFACPLSSLGVSVRACPVRTLWWPAPCATCG